MNILERLDMLEQKVEYFEKLISTGGNMDDTPFKYSRKKAPNQDDISKLKSIVSSSNEFCLSSSRNQDDISKLKSIVGIE